MKESDIVKFCSIEDWTKYIDTGDSSLLLDIEKIAYLQVGSVAMICGDGWEAKVRIVF